MLLVPDASATKPSKDPAPRKVRASLVPRLLDRSALPPRSQSVPVQTLRFWLSQNDRPSPMLATIAADDDVANRVAAVVAAARSVVFVTKFSSTK